MGANIGTTVTNTIVSLVQIQDRSIFRRAFGGATIHDVFNCLTVLVLLPVEVISGYLYQLTKAIVSTIETDGDADTKRDILKKVTKPFIKLFVEIDKKIIKDLAKSKEIDDSATLLKRWCKYTSATVTEVKDVFEVHSKESLNNSYVDKLLRSRMNFTMTDNEQNVTLHWNQLFSRNISIPTKRCSNLFAMTNLSDDVVGTIILFVSMLLIIICLVLVVKILNSLFKGAIARVVKKFMNSDFPGRMAWLTGYIAILIGTGLTMVIQSSSILTSTLTPLVGVGLLSLDRMLPLTIGANIGTTLTGILAALAVPASRIPYTLQVALCHLFFNISGALLFYPVPVLRRIPIQLAKMLGTVTAKYRWFSIIYLILVFFGIPAFVFGLSIAGDDVIMAVGIPILTLLIFIVILNTMQNICPNALPKKLQNWKFLPIWFRSLEPYDKMLCCCFNNDTVKKSILKQKGTIELKSHCHDNKAFDLVNP